MEPGGSDVSVRVINTWGKPLTSEWGGGGGGGGGWSMGRVWPVKHSWGEKLSISH